MADNSTESAPATATVATAATATGGDPVVDKMADFSDKLSPMLVKELRQGMRTNIFTIAFILLQAFMVLCMWLGILEDSQGGTTAFFWTLIVITMLIVQPIRGFSALSSEMTLNTMDLIQLTRLGAWRITFGKWASIVAQSLLLLTGVLPYVVLRYYQGGVNPLEELGWIFLITLASLLLTAITVGFSSFKSVLLRVALLIGIGITTMVGITTFSVGRAFGTMGGPAVTPGVPWWEISASVIVAIYATYYFLDLGASRIAPESANHSSRKRFISLIFMIIMLVLPIFGLEPYFGLVTAGIVFVIVGVDSLTESPSVLPGVLRPFARNSLTRFSAGFLTPGWHTGIRYFLILAVIYCGGLWANLYIEGDSLSGMLDYTVLISSVATITFPLLIIHLFFFPVTYSQFYFGLYVLIQVCVGALGLFVASVANGTSSSTLDPLLYMCFPIPFVNLLSAAGSDNDDAIFFLASCVFFVFSLLIPASRSRPIFKRMRQTFKAIHSGTDDSITEQNERQIIPKGAD